ncbi:MAG: DUF1420 family protein [Acidobacteriota bacterium]
MNGLQSLDSLLLQPPLPAIASALAVAGTWGLSDFLRRRFLPEITTTLERVGVFFVTVGVLCGLVHAVAWVGLEMHLVLRVLGLALVGCTALTPWRSLPAVWKRLVAPGGQRIRHWSVALTLACALGLTLAALGPPTDNDSMRYHLAVPLRWWAEGRAVPQLESLHPRLVGPGESLVLLGFALGTDNLSAAFQAAALVAWLVVLASLGGLTVNRASAALMVAAAPVMLFLVPDQKPQLLPAVSLAVSFALLITPGNRRRIWLASACGLFALSCKASFLLDGAALFGLALGWFVPRSGGKRRDLVLALSLLSLLFLLPQLARNQSFYGDPLTPMLERFRAEPDPAVVAFASHLRRFGAVAEWQQNPLQAVEILIPLSLGSAPKSLGIGALAWLWLVPSLPQAAAGLAVALNCAFGQVTGRFLLCPFLWLSALVASGGPRRGMGAFRWLMLFQGALVASLCLAAGLELFPGALTSPWREKVMKRSALTYTTAEFCHQHLRPGDRLLLEEDGHAFFPLPYLAVESYSDLGSSSTWQAAKRWLAVDHRPTYLLTKTELVSPLRALLAPCMGGEPIARHKSQIATRNPLNRRPGPELGLFRLDLDRPECRSLLLAPTLARPPAAPGPLKEVR